MENKNRYFVRGHVENSRCKAFDGIFANTYEEAADILINRYSDIEFKRILVRKTDNINQLDSEENDSEYIYVKEL